MSAEPRQRTALDHLFFWFLFANGGVITALLVPVHVLVQGILGPLGIVPVVDRQYDTWVRVLSNPLVKLYLIVLFLFAYFHFAHRIRYFLTDLGLHAAKSRAAELIFYGGAFVLTLLTAWVLLTSAPISFG